MLRSLRNVRGSAADLDFPKPDLRGLDDLANQVEAQINELYEKIPAEVKEKLEQLRNVTSVEPSAPGAITDEEKKAILEDIDKLFKKGDEGQ